MNIQQTEKIRQLVKSSVLLSPNERQEWLQLLELMNDKQLLELQRILESAQKPKPGSLPKIGPLPEAVKRPQSGLPSFHHIMNLPHVGGRLSGQTAEAIKQKPISNLSEFLPKLGAKPGLIEKASKTEKSASGGFLTRLKEILAEKELPAPKPERLLEPAAEFVKPVLTPLTPRPTALPKVPLPRVPLPRAPLPARSFVSAPLPTRPPSPAPSHTLVIQKEKEIVREAPQVVVKSDLPKLEYSSVGSPPSGAEQTPAKGKITIAELSEKLNRESRALKSPQGGAGVSFAKTSEKARLGILDTIKIGHSQTAADIAKKGAMAADELGLNSLAELTSLRPEVLKQNLNRRANILQNALKSLIGRFGYHQVVLNLERSPLYGAYMDTGLKVLNQQTAFGQEPKEPGKQNLLSKEQFERFVDVLRKIQAE